jgi:hypothetical protein
MTNRDARDTDGYKMKKTADGTYVFVEGRDRTPYDLTREEMARFRACLRRRGIRDTFRR